MSVRERISSSGHGWFANASIGVRPFEEWTLLGLFGLTLTCVVVSVVGGATGLAAAAGFVVAWLVLPAVPRYAVGHALALAGTATSYSVVELLFLELGLVAVLFGPLTRTEYRNRRATAASMLWVGTALFGAVTVGLSVFDELWMTATVLVLAVAALAYGYQRIGLGRLGRLDAGDAEGATK